MQINTSYKIIYKLVLLLYKIIDNYQKIYNLLIDIPAHLKIIYAYNII